MQTAISELPLALFTTFVLIGAGAFAFQSLVALVSAPEQGEGAKGFSVATLAPLALVIVGFICAFAHLANPLNAPFALMGVGSSPMSNEIAMGSLFTVVALVFVVLDAMGKLQGAARKVFNVALLVLGVLFALFTGLAYYVETIISWGMAYTVLETVGLSLFAGGVLGAFLMTRQSDEAFSAGSARAIAFVFVIGGAVVALAALLLHASAVSGFETVLFSGAAIVSAATPAFACAVLCGVVAVVCACVGIAKDAKWALPAACVFALVAVFFARLAFYAIQLSVAL